MEPLSRKENLLGMLADEPEDAFLHYALGLEYAAENKYTEALRYLRRTVELDEAYTAAYYQLGKLYAYLDLVDVAKTYWEKGLALALLAKDHRTAAEFREMLDETDY